jgi:arylsulfatase
MIVTDGGRFGGYGLYLLKGKPVFTYNLLAAEKFRWEGRSHSHRASIPEFDFQDDGPGMAKGGTGVLRVDGKDLRASASTMYHSGPS